MRISQLITKPEQIKLDYGDLICTSLCDVDYNETVDVAVSNLEVKKPGYQLTVDAERTKIEVDGKYLHIN